MLQQLQMEREALKQRLEQEEQFRLNAEREYEKAANLMDQIRTKFRK